MWFEDGKPIISHLYEHQKRHIKQYVRDLQAAKRAKSTEEMSYSVLTTTAANHQEPNVMMG